MKCQKWRFAAWLFAFRSLIAAGSETGLELIPAARILEPSSRIRWEHIPLEAASCESLLLASGRILYGKYLHGGPSRGRSNTQNTLGVVLDLDTRQTIHLSDYFRGAAHIVGMDPEAGWAVVGASDEGTNDRCQFFKFDFKTRTSTPLAKGVSPDLEAALLQLGRESALAGAQGAARRNELAAQTGVMGFDWRFPSFREAGAALSPHGHSFVGVESTASDFTFTVWDMRDPRMPSVQYSVESPVPTHNHRASDLRVSDDGRTFAFHYREGARGGFTRTQLMKVGARSGKLKTFHIEGSIQFMSDDGTLLITRRARKEYQAYDLRGGRPQSIDLKNLKSIVGSLWRIGPGDEGMNPVRIASAKMSPDRRWLAVEFNYEVILAKAANRRTGFSLSSGTNAQAVVRWDLSQPNAKPDVFDSSDLMEGIAAFDFLLRDDGLILLGALSSRHLAFATSDHPQQVVTVPYADMIPEQYSPYRGISISRDAGTIGISLSDSTMIFDLRALGR